MAEVKIEIPEDLSEEFTHISKEEWQLLFSRFLKEELERIKKVESIVAKSKLTEKQAKKLADEVNLSLAKRYEKLLRKR
jgi:hypothetical protein